MTMGNMTSSIDWLKVSDIVSVKTMNYQKLKNETRLILDTCDHSEVYFTWRWLRDGQDHIIVSESFKNAWNNCNVFEWIDHREEYGVEFERLSNVYKNVFDAQRANVCHQLTGVMEVIDDLRICGIIVDAIQKIKNG